MRATDRGSLPLAYASSFLYCFHSLREFALSNSSDH